MHLSEENSDPEQKRRFLGVTQTTNDLSRLTLRQLRHKASDLGVPLYSRKSKETLIKEIALKQQKKEEEQRKKSAFWRAPSKQSGNQPQSTEQEDTRIVFLPRDPEWAYVFWEISELDRNRALARGANRLCIRLADVTGIKDGTAHPHALQEVQVDSHSTEWYLPVPMSDRDYRVELGYRFGSSWMSLAFSSAARVPSLTPSNQVLDQFVPFNLETAPGSDTSISTHVESKPADTDTGLHERLYQTATTHFLKRRIGSEEFQEAQTQQKNFSESGVGLWESGRNESGLGGVNPRQRSLWLVADAELIVYGSTDPSAKLSIGGEEVPLSSDGTFHLQVPFRDGKQNYPIEALAADGKQKCNITMNFERTTPEDNSIPKELSQPEWF